MSARTPETLWDIRGLELRWTPGARPLFEGVDWRVRQGEFWALLGPNGAGKSTLALAMLGWLRPSGGELLYRGRPVAGWKRRDFAQRVAWLPQREEHGFALSAVEVAALGAYARGGALALGRSADDRAAAMDALERVGMADLAEAPFPRLSGGERQLVLLARCLVQDTEALVLDEPSAALDPRRQRKLFDLLEGLRGEGKTVVAIVHDLNVAARRADKAAILADGRLQAAGPVADVLTPERLGEVYGVRFKELRGDEGERALVAV